MAHQLTPLDWSWIIGFLILAFGLSVYHTRKSSVSIENYFVAGKNTPWWILGTSIVATTFAADTPLAICGLVITDGIAGNWFWWSVVPSGMLGVYFFAPLWRRSNCLTQAEFAILRYGPQRAPALRLFYVFYHGVLRNSVTLGWVNLAMAKIITLCSTLGKWEALGICMVLTVTYTILGGITGVMWTDFMQFILAIGTALCIAYYAVEAVGGLSELRRSLTSVQTDYFAHTGTTQFGAMLIFVTLYWVFCTPTDCNGYAVQRLLSARNERHAVWGYLWYNVAHFVLRSWPWIIVGLCAVVALNRSSATIEDPEAEYVYTILRHAPHWLVGPALASLLAAYMSTIDTHLNWGASYLINDFYMPYINPGQSSRHYVRASRLTIAAVAAVGIGATALMTSIVSGWGLFFGLTSGMGLVGILRWLWWRVTAWTEIGCMSGAGVATLFVHTLTPDIAFPFTLLIIIPVAMVGAAIGTFAFSPEPRDVLLKFCDQVRPPGTGWHIPKDLPTTAVAPRAYAVTGEKLQAGASGNHSTTASKPECSSTMHAAGGGLLILTLCWIMGTSAVYCALFGVGNLLLKSQWWGILLCAAAAVLALLSGHVYRRTHI